MQLQPWTHVQLNKCAWTKYSESKNQTLVSIAEAEGYIK